MHRKTLLLPLLLGSTIYASELDLGLGFAGFSYPDYLGSDQQNSLVFPYPYVIYKNDTLEIDNKGVQKDLLTFKDLTLRVSLSGALPVKSSGIRENMQKLDPSGEIGPAIFYNIYDKEKGTIALEFPLRAVLSTDFKSIEYQGYLYEAKIRTSYETDSGYLLKFRTGAIWGDERYHNHIYGVPENMETQIRPSYKAKAGYTGYKNYFSISKTFNNTLIRGFVSHYSLSHSIIKNSPLKVKNYALYGGINLIYIFDKSISKPIKEWIEK